MKSKQNFPPFHSQKSGSNQDSLFLYVKKYCEMDHTYIFFLSNKDIQAIFSDSSELIVST